MEVFLQFNNIKPGSNKALLILLNPPTAYTGRCPNGAIARQNGMMFTKAKNVELVYTLEADKNTTTDTQVGFSTLNTPAGQQHAAK